MKSFACVALAALLLGITGTAFAVDDPAYDFVVPISAPAADDDVVAEVDACGSCAAGCCDNGCEQCYTACDPYLEAWRNIRLSMTVDGFKGPMDLDNLNGNFGVNFAVNGGFPLIDRMGLGVQVGTSAILSDFHGTQFTGSTIRSQNFTTVGIFQRRTTASGRNWKWGVAHDWLYDKYYSTFTMSQWRAKLGYEINADEEIGLLICSPGYGDSVVLGQSLNRFTPVGQYQVYYRRCWPRDASTMIYLGAVEEPGEVVIGSRMRLPLTGRTSIVANFNYVLPSASGVAGQDEEMWNVAMGIEIIPGWGGNRCRESRYSPILPLADNGIFAIRRH